MLHTTTGRNMCTFEEINTTKIVITTTSRVLIFPLNDDDGDDGDDIDMMVVSSDSDKEREDYVFWRAWSMATLQIY